MHSISKWTLPALALAALTIGCEAGPAAGGASNPGAPTLRSCGPEGIIDDGEDNNNRIAPVSGRGGYWYAYGDKLNSTISPAPGGTFAMSAGGANGSKFGANMKGKIGAADQPPLYLSVGMGLGFTDPRSAYDAGRYKGIAFWAKKGKGSSGKARLKVPDVNTDPQGKVCTDACFNDFGADLDLTEAWTRYAFGWSDLHQLSGWGSPSPAAITEQKLYGIQFQVNEPTPRSPSIRRSASSGSNGSTKRRGVVCGRPAWRRSRRLDVRAHRAAAIGKIATLPLPEA